MRTYLFYDIESTGLNTAFDQVLRFASVRTDATFKEIERHLIRIRLRSDVIFSPRAMITNRISIADAGLGKCEYEAIQQIHGLMNTPDTISLGYNTLGFDDEFLRFSFYRNLLPPYTHQYSNGCYRMDLLPIAIIFRLYKRNVLNWPKYDGRPTLKLEHLSAVNGLAEGPAHDAMVDAEATVALARRFLKEKDIWQYVEGYFDKETDGRRIEKLPVAFRSEAGAHSQGLMIGSEYGPEQQYQVPVLAIGRSIPYSNQTLWLRLDLAELRNTQPENIADTTWVIRKRFGEPGIILPPHARYWKYLSPERTAIVEENLDWLQSHPALFQNIIQYHREFSYPKIPDLDVDAALYEGGFLSRREEELCRQFHAAPPADKHPIVERFPKAATREIARRLLFRNYPEDLPDPLSKEFEAYMHRVNPLFDEDVLRDYRGERRMTPAVAISEIQDLRNESTLDRRQLELLDDLERHIMEKFSA